MNKLEYYSYIYITKHKPLMKTVTKNGREYQVLPTFQDVEVEAMKDLAFVTEGTLKVRIIDGTKEDDQMYNLCEAYKDSGSVDYFYYAYPVYIS